jgi:hypothetical protein
MRVLNEIADGTVADSRIAGAGGLSMISLSRFLHKPLYSAMVVAVVCIIVLER